MSHITERHQAPLAEPADTGGRAVSWALLTSWLVAVLTAVLLLVPDLNARVYLPDDSALARPWLSGPVFTGVLLGIAVLGAVTALLARSRPRVTGAVAVAQVVTFALLAQGMSTLSVFGYLTAFGVPVILVILAVQLFRTHARARIAVLLAGAVAIALAVLERDVLASYVTTMAPALLQDVWQVLAVVLTIATAVAWAAVLLRMAARRGGLVRATRWVTRHRVLLTVIAALGPVPYGLARLSWLTPWRLLGGDNVAGDPAMLLQGLMLGAAAWLGVVLTLGLIARWGEVFPRWFPGYAGRPVPPLFAIIPGGGVALMLCGSAIPMLQLLGWHGALFFPAWLWGPALALAVWGYAGHRAGVLASSASHGAREPRRARR